MERGAQHHCNVVRIVQALGPKSSDFVHFDTLSIRTLGLPLHAILVSRSHNITTHPLRSQSLALPSPSTSHPHNLCPHCLVETGFQTASCPHHHVSQSPILHQARHRGACRWATCRASVNDSGVDGPLARAVCGLAWYMPTMACDSGTSGTLPCIQPHGWDVHQGAQGVQHGAVAGRLVAAEQHSRRDVSCRRRPQRAHQ